MSDGPFREQFRLKRLKLSHPRRALFTSSSFLSEGNFFAVKFFLFLWTFCFLLASASESINEPRWQVYLTNWSYTVQTIYHFLGAIATLQGVLEHQKNIEEDGETVSHSLDKPTTILHSVQWLFFSVNSPIALTISLLYYTLLTPKHYIISIATHAINSLTTIIDLFIINIPVHLAHYVYALAYAAIYIIFTIIYSSVDGTNENGKPYVYSVLHWSKSPAKALLYSLVTAFIVIPLCKLLVFGLFRLRMALSQRLNGAPIMVFETPLQGSCDIEMNIV